MIKKFLLLTTLLVSTIQLFAANSFIIGIGTDYSLITLNIGYKVDLENKILNQNSNVTIGVKTPLLRPDLKDFSIYTDYEIEPLSLESFKLPIVLGLRLKAVSNSAFNSIGIATTINLKPQFIGDYIDFGADMLWESQWLTYLKPSTKYLLYVNPDSKPSWYFNTSNTLRIGGLLLYKNLSNTSFLLKAGYQYQGEYDFKLPPFYAVTGSILSF